MTWQNTVDTRVPGSSKAQKPSEALKPVIEEAIAALTTYMKSLKRSTKGFIYLENGVEISAMCIKN